jgi:mono/diheme cytochrome c family protein
MRFALALSALAFAVPAFGADVDFARDVRPIFAKHCVRCHGAKKHEGGLRLDVRRLALVGGDTGPAVVPGTARGELLRRILSSDDKLRMPPDGDPLTAEQVATLKAWAEQGAKWPDEFAGKEPADDHWAFKPVKRPDVPRGAPHPVDAFVLAKLSDKALTLSAEADRRALFRRLHLDLIGLPPTPDEVAAFLWDTSANAYEKQVARLLASPHFGERWGRHWLDLARFAESDGYENDNLRPEAYRYRDWVVRAFNDDVPFDRFTVEQLAGDLLPNATNEQKTATGFHRNTLWNSAASGDKEEFRTYAVKDRVETTGLAWMGLTLGCAKCHSHKYDPVAHREFYRLYAFFNQTDNAEVRLEGKAYIPVLREVKRDTYVHTRGNFLQKGEAVAPGTPAFLPPLKARGASADRLDLARWLVDPAHPLTARVAVNHVWQHLFGEGLVRTPENFGTKGEKPTHPELLDWLASEFVRLKWSRKALIKLVVTSATYKQSSARTAKLSAADPTNALLARQNRFRVEAEIVRDLALSTSGLLNPKLGGPSIVPPFPDGLLAQKFTAESLKMPGPEQHRRGIYVHVQRTLQHPTLAVFDAADGNTACAKRDRSTTPLQALALLNDPVFVECAKALGARIAKHGGDTTEARLRYGFELCLSRAPTARELAILTELVEAHEKLRAKPDAVWFGVARTLLNLEEFTTRE